VADVPPNVRFTGKHVRRSAKIAYASIVVALVGSGLGFIPPPDETPVVVNEAVPSPPPESEDAGDRILEAGRDLADALRGLGGQSATPTPTPVPPRLPAVTQVSSPGMAKVFSIILGLGAVFLGAFSWFKREKRWATGAAIVLGLFTVAWNAVVVAVAAALFAAIAILLSMRLGSKGLTRPAK
jgi:hypothetical protein